MKLSQTQYYNIIKKVNHSSILPTQNGLFLFIYLLIDYVRLHYSKTVHVFPVIFERVYSCGRVAICFFGRAIWILWIEIKTDQNEI